MDGPNDGIPMDEGGELEDITIRTRKPGKWRFVDSETGQVWRWDGDRGQFLLTTLDDRR